MIPSFSRVNLWMTLVLAATLFSGMCLEQSTAFTAPFTAPVAGSSSPNTVAPRFFSCVVPLRMSMVTDAPTKPKTDKKSDTTVEVVKGEDTEKEPKNGKNGWEIQLFNDGYNHRTFVAKCLCTICGKTDGQSYQIMMQAHKNGMGVVGRYHYEIAELYYGALKGEGLTVDMVEVDDE